MRILLDTHILVWLMEGNPQLKPRSRALIESAEEIFASSASVWEIAIKAPLGKIKTDPEMLASLLEQAGIVELPVTNKHALAVCKLPLLHRDPFDRLLVAQAIAEPMRLLTADAKLAAYSHLVITV